MRTQIVDLAKISVGTPVQRIVTLNEEVLCGTKLALGEVLIYKTSDTRIFYIVNKKGTLHKGILPRASL
jgi:hypothetical protein